MKKLIRGIVDFRKNVQPSYREKFARLALGQKPDSLFFACSDSRVVPNVFASSEPGDLFVLRNVGNLIAPCGPSGLTEKDGGEVAAIEFATLSLEVSDVVVCGHSECGAMKAICGGRQNVQGPHLANWLRHGEPAWEKLKAGQSVNPGLQEHNTLSQLNVLQQMEHLLTYPLVRERVQSGKLKIHGWWFDIAQADVYAYMPKKKAFVLIDDEAAEEMLQRLEK